METIFYNERKKVIHHCQDAVILSVGDHFESVEGDTYEVTHKSFDLATHTYHYYGSLPEKG